MKNRMIQIIRTLGGAAALSLLLAVPVFADGTDTGAIQQTEASEESVWDTRAVANVISCANIRSEGTIESARVGILPSGAMADVVEKGESWTRISSGGIEGYIRNDLLAFGEEARAIYEALYGSSVAAALPANDGADHAGSQTMEDASAGSEETSEETVTDETASEETVSEETAQAETPQEEAVPEVEAQPVPEEQPAPEEEAAEEAAEVGVSGGELDLLAAIIQCEAGGESHEGKVAVGAVIMNRIQSSDFPNSISDVVYQSGQFSPVASGKLSSVLQEGARSDCYAAAQEALNGVNPVGNSLYFNSGSGRGIQIGNQHFY